MNIYSKENLKKYLRPTFSPEVEISSKPIHVVSAKDVHRINQRLQPIIEANAVERQNSLKLSRNLFVNR